ncbi:MAG: hypothetical protein HQK60_16715 [Deltaproteobacteria bacterium]|nr:hypothetical protein [Deltaproteobacteria bacterium]
MLDLGKMGAGEKEVISLAAELKVVTILTDDQKAISRAAQLDLNFDILESEDVLKLAKRGGILHSVKQVLDNMRINKEHLEDEVYWRILEEAGEI